ncbi:uroporphyrinogen-III synthase [Legionella fairfieldensis]|uniref:uroporphyrinogen-III synthase n=1 Tax=Legionella fairfieldensis TaxID=45064 RepID=UPI00048C9C1B|nr:uroporphyrinogen-III synthase [Legionella fairfieldensis]
MNSLQGLRVLNTRPVEQAKALSQAIETAGGTAIECPALTIVPTSRAWLSSLPVLHKVDQAIFVSANAVTHFFTSLKQERLQWPSTIQIIAIGPATATALAQYHIRVDWIPAITDSEHLLKLEIMRAIHHKTILLIKGEEGRDVLEKGLTARGTNLIPVNVYRRQLPEPNPQYISSLWHNDAVDIILFTSEQAMNNLFTLFGEEAYTWLCSKPGLVISKRLAEAAALAGIQTILVSSPENLLKTLYQFNQGLIHGQ